MPHFFNNESDYDRRIEQLVSIAQHGSREIVMAMPCDYERELVIRANCGYANLMLGLVLKLETGVRPKKMAL